MNKKYIDISNKLEDQKVVLKLSEGKEFEVNNSYKLLLKAMSLFGQNDKEIDGVKAMENMLTFIEDAIGKDGRLFCENKTIKQIEEIFNIIMKVIQGEDGDGDETFQG